MYVCYKRESIFEIFARFCVIIFAYVGSVSFGVKDSQNEAQFVPSHFVPLKNYFEPPQ